MIMTMSWFYGGEYSALLKNVEAAAAAEESLIPVILFYFVLLSPISLRVSLMLHGQMLPVAQR